ncbi:amino acid adenylation domain-containing protein [Vibrio alginolyticus]|uniref:non-ribosomal peptide synthetase n=1 Tax=Vibrio alginolyticus TaxID=663 RepID=UPI001BD64D2A|nr:non-ribosomal peptide synthetase [Vibrio alginolyticus]MBT0050824.1 amino acid adenylation domain-containing protein [Vibrio alginolyticus]
MNQSKYLSPSNNTILPLTSYQSWQLSTQRQRSEQQAITNFIYQEFEYNDTSKEALERCLVTLINHHPMLHARISDDFYLHIAKNNYTKAFNVNELSEVSEEEIEKQLALTRTALIKSNSQAILCISISLLPLNRIRLHARFNSVVVDTQSVSIFFEQLDQMLAGNLPSFSCQTEALTAHHDLVTSELTSMTFSSSEWEEHILKLPKSVNLPTVCEPDKLSETGISRRTVSIPSEKWQQLATRSKNHSVTPELTLATIFAAVLSQWGHQETFMLRFDTSPKNRTKGIIGQFTQPLLANLSGFGHSFLSLVRENQKHFKHTYPRQLKPIFSLVHQLSRLSDAHRAPANIAFSSQLTETNRRELWGCRQSANTWLSLHAELKKDELVLYWDSHDALFPKNMIQEMLVSYTGLLDSLSQRDSDWTHSLPILLPENQISTRNAFNSSEAHKLPEGLLHHGFWKNVETFPNAIAVIHGHESLSYQTLASYAQSCAGALAKAGVAPGDRVAVSMNKGVGQIVAVLGILYAGAVYVPVSLDQPQERREGIYQCAGINVVLTDKSDAKDSMLSSQLSYLDWQATIKSIPMTASPEIEPNKPAYIIYTSGSTGTPKGVVISHQGALNTCIALNQRYQINSNDRVLALSALHFDLSVYDIFGLLSAGGAIVLVNESERRDPRAWCRVIEKNNVTMWNSVPALFDMLLTYASSFRSSAPSELRLTMLSGDWIGLDLPDRYRQYRPDGKFIAMGGATEASIWSNVFDVQHVPPEWRSIPYGYPLPRQQYRVVDDFGRDCPDWVAGELWIGGDGVALGYFDDKLKTQAQFLHIDGCAWYRTGDMGCYWPDGTLEFLGRRDKQVKIGGYRIELGEIEVALNNIPQVQRAIAIAVGKQDKTLAAFIVLDPEQENAKRLDTNEVQNLLSDQLPNYMIPKRIVFLDALPLTANGKVDHKTLSQMTSRKKNKSSAVDQPLVTSSEHKLAEIWRKVLGVHEFCKSSDFFQMGGDAYAAIEVLKHCHQAGYPIKLSVLYRYPSLETLALIMDKCKSTTPQGIS